MEAVRRTQHDGIAERRARRLVGTVLEVRADEHDHPTPAPARALSGVRAPPPLEASPFVESERCKGRRGGGDPREPEVQGCVRAQGQRRTSLQSFSSSLIAA